MNAFILGAGASLHAGYPLCNELAHSLKQWTIRDSEAKQHFQGLVEQLEEKADVSNLEKLLTDIVEGRVDFLGWGNYRGRLEYAIRHYFRYIRRTHSASGYESFAQRVQPGDVVITFNYDVAVEKELKIADKFHIGNGYGFTIGQDLTPASKVKVFKLHGSANWIGSIFEGAPSGSVFAIGSHRSLGLRPVIPTDELEFLGYEGVKDPRFRIGGGFITPMILPTLSKDFYFKTSLGIEWEEFWDSLWNQAKEALKQAIHVFLLGYSMPIADERARELILLNVKKDARITICCFRDSVHISKQFKNAKFQNIETLEDVRFEQWAASTCNDGSEHLDSKRSYLKNVSAG